MDVPVGPWGWGLVLDCTRNEAQLQLRAGSGGTVQLSVATCGIMAASLSSEISQKVLRKTLAAPVAPWVGSK